MADEPSGRGGQNIRTICPDSPGYVRTDRTAPLRAVRPVSGVRQRRQSHDRQNSPLFGTGHETPTTPRVDEVGEPDPAGQSSGTRGSSEPKRMP
jgi:hypothetical protein